MSAAVINLGGPIRIPPADLRVLAGAAVRPPSPLGQLDPTGFRAVDLAARLLATANDPAEGSERLHLLAEERELLRRALEKMPIEDVSGSLSMLRIQLEVLA
jgi:hypothetical protein